MQMKAFIQTSDTDVTLITIINRATEQDETLLVHPSKSMWVYHARPSYAQEKPPAPERHSHNQRQPLTMRFVRG